MSTDYKCVPITKIKYILIYIVYMYVCRILNRFSMRHYNMTYSLRTTVPYDFPFFCRENHIQGFYYLYSNT